MWIKLALHQAVTQMHEGNLYARLGEAIHHLYAEQAAADHGRAGTGFRSLLSAAHGESRSRPTPLPE
jgi:hypothetical protein